MTRDELLGAGQRLFDGAGQSIGSLQPGDQVLVDPLVALLPGLAAQLPQVQELERHAMQQALEQHADRLVQRGQALSFITALPWLQQAITPRSLEPQPAPVEEAPPPLPATHLLQGAQAVPLVAAGTPVADGWELFDGGDGWQLRGDGAPPRVNDEDYADGQRLGAGDSIAIGGQVGALLIEVRG